MNRPADPLDAYLHREIRFHHGGRTLACRVANSLFSRGGVDAGTRQLLDSLVDRPEPAKARDKPAGPDAPAAILDLGCGWGALSLALAVEFPETQIVGVDRDWLAVRYTAANAAANGLTNVTALPSLGYSRLFGVMQPLGGDAPADGLPCQVDWIVANLPAKVGETGLLDLTFGAGPLLRPGGRVAVVYVNALDAIMRESLEVAREFAPVEMEREIVKAEHTVWHMRMPEGLPVLRYDIQEDEDAEDRQGTPSDGLIPFRRDDAPPILDDAPWEAVFNVAEFDTLDYRSDLVAKALHQTPRPEREGERPTLLLFNPLHGMLARMLIAERRPRRVILVDRDLLALAVSARNVENWLELHVAGDTEVEVHTHLGVALGLSEWREAFADVADGESPIDWVGTVDVIAGVFNADEGRGGLRLLLQQAAEWLRPDGVVALGLTAAEVTTLLKPAAQGERFRYGRALKRRGFAAQVLRPGRGRPGARESEG